MTQGSFSQLVDYIPDRLARLAGLPGAQEAAACLRASPMFCMETAVKLFYWMRLACEARAARRGGRLC